MAHTRAREALDFLIARRPGISDFSALADNWNEVLLQAFSFHLWAGVLDAQSFREKAVKYEALLDDKFEFWRENRDNVVVVSAWTGDMQAAKTVFFEEFDDLRVTHGWWDTIFDAYLLADFRKEPDVAA